MKGTTMTHDQEGVKRLQHLLGNWNPDEVCKSHWEGSPSDLVLLALQSYKHFARNRC
jgi:hypothetical protein